MFQNVSKFLGKKHIINYSQIDNLLFFEVRKIYKHIKPLFKNTNLMFTVFHNRNVSSQGL